MDSAMSITPDFHPPSPLMKMAIEVGLSELLYIFTDPNPPKVSVSTLMACKELQNKLIPIQKNMFLIVILLSLKRMLFRIFKDNLFEAEKRSVRLS